MWRISGAKPAFSSCDSTEVQVKDSRIDHMRLIHNLTKSSSTKQSMFRSKNRRRGRSAFQSLQRSPHEDSIEFVLEVRCSQRQYTLIKSLPSIRDLRQELVEECEDRHLFQEKVVDVPPLPALQEQGATTNAASSAPSFMMLQSMLITFRPQLEEWFRKLVQAISVEESACLSEFLKEPVCQPRLEKLFHLESKLPAKLHSIEESDATEEDDW